MRKIALLICLLFSLCGMAQEYIQMHRETSGIYTIPCEVNGLRLRFILDTGASNVSLSMTEANFMYKNGYLTDEDILGTANTRLADGSISENAVVNLKEIKIGSCIVKDVKALVIKSDNAPLLLGQSVLSNVGKWSIDGSQFVLQEVFNPEYSDWETAKAKALESLDTLDCESAANIIKPFLMSGNQEALYMYAGDCLGDIMTSEDRYCMEHITALADQNDPQACMILGRYYSSRKIYDKSRYYYTRTSGSSNYGEACFWIAFDYEDLSDINNAMSWYKISMDVGYVRSAEKIAEIYKEQGKYQYAIQSFNKAAAMGSPDAETELARLYKEQNKVQLSVQAYNKAISMGSSEAVMELAEMYLKGDGVVKNIQKGVSILSASNSASANIKLTECYFYGIYVKKNISKAKIYLDKIPLKDRADRSKKYFLEGFIEDSEGKYYDARNSFENGFDNNKFGNGAYIGTGFEADAHILLGTYYQEGKGGVDQNTLFAYEHYMMASDLGDFSAYGFMGDLYVDEELNQVDYEQAFNLYKQGAVNNDPYCCYKLGVFYEEGLGVDKNIAQAKKWKAKAKFLGYVEQ